MKEVSFLERGRIMVAFGYHGGAFHGSQIQPNVATVEKEIQTALKRMSWWEPGCLEMSSRTDSGVNVRMNLACIDVPMTVWKEVEKTTIIRALNNRLPSSMTVWDVVRVEPDVRSRGAIRRHYLFRTEMMEEWPEEIDSELFSQVCKMIEGTHDFTNFCRLEEGKNPVRTIDYCRPWLAEDGRIIGFSIASQAFLWNQVRRIASAICGVMSGRISINDVSGALENPTTPQDLGRAQPEGLLLWAIEHSAAPELGMSLLPNTTGFTLKPELSHRYKRWLSMAKIEMSLMMERKWMESLNVT